MSGINPNWLEAHEASLKEKADIETQLAAKIGDYVRIVEKDYLAAWKERGLTTEEKNTAAFAPLVDFLAANFAENKDAIKGFMIFMGVRDDKFEFKNDMTRDYIVFDRFGNVIEQEAYALDFYADED
ncbi:hypothetical protein KV564_26400 [Paenibacillus chitinolyticus]|nr:hypothetical protein [Paenibacillus chitinolyticus]